MEGVRVSSFTFVPNSIFMKRVLFSLWMMLAVSAFAQEAKYGLTPYGKVQHPAVSKTFEAPAAIVEEILKKKMNDAQLKATAKSAESGFKVMKGVKWNDVATQTIDVYYKVEGNKEKTAATAFIMTSLGNDNFLTNEANPTEISNTLTFLDNMLKDVNVAKALADIKPVEAKVSAAEKKVESIKKEGDKLQTEKRSLEGQIASNLTAQSTLQSDIDNQERMVEIAKSQTGTLEQMNVIKKDIQKQEDALEKLQKKLASSQKDAEKFKYNLAKTEEKIKQNETDVEKAKEELATQRATLQSMREQYESLKR